MMNEFDKRHIESLKSSLARYLNWGDVEHWSTRNFEYLSQQIFENTSIQLSVSTLKRFLGKVAYNNKPAPATLDAIAIFIGYKNYLDYCSSIEESTGPTLNRIPTKKLFISLVLVLLIVGVGVTLSFIDLSSSSVDPSKVSFSIKKVTTGLPNTVVFEYDVTQVNASAVEIQQDWDPTKRHKVDPNNRVFTHYYEYPGYYNAKLVINGDIILEEDLFIPSDGWMSVISYPQEEKPIRYLMQNEFESDSVLRVYEDIYKDLHGNPDKVVLDYYNALPEPQLDFEDFEFKAQIKFNLQSGKVPCEYRKLIFFGTKMFMRIPISVPGCVSKNKLKLGNLVIDGAENDLSALSTESGKWSKIEVKNKANHVSIFLDSELVFESNLIDDFGKLAGVRISFDGSGEVRDLNLSSKGNELLVLE